MSALVERFPLAAALIAGFFGAAIGSFLNVLIYRLPRGENIAFPGSRCPGCKNAIAWYDNVPVVSWLILRGKCRRCGTRISPRYPLVEACTAVLALAALRTFGPTLDALAIFAFFAILLAITFIDLEHWLILHTLSWPGIALGLLYSFAPGRLAPLDSAIGAASGFVLFWLVGFLGEKVFKKEALGGGDKWLLALIGAFLGWKALLPVILVASFTGAVVGILLLVARKGAPPPPPPELPPTPGEEAEDAWVPPAHAVPFGPFLSLAAMVVVLFEEELRRIMLFPR